MTPGAKNLILGDNTVHRETGGHGGLPFLGGFAGRDTAGGISGDRGSALQARGDY
jgi:hypothetical protein